MRHTLLLLVAFLLTLTGCLGDDFLGGPPVSSLRDTYGSAGTPVRGAYTLGAQVSFEAELIPEDEGAEVEIAILGDGLTVSGIVGNTVMTDATSVGSGEIVFSLRGEEVERYPYDVLAVDRVAFRRVVSLFGREDVGDELLVARDDTVDVIVDYYAGERRLFGRGIVDYDGRVETTINNDHVFLNTSADGVQVAELSVDGRLFEYTYEVAGSIANLELTVDRLEDGSAVATAIATDAEGRIIQSLPQWTLDGMPLESRIAPLHLSVGPEEVELTATLLDASASAVGAWEGLAPIDI